MTEADQAEMQAECVVRALDAYLACQPTDKLAVTAHARKFLVQTLAATIRMKEPRKSDLQR